MSPSLWPELQQRAAAEGLNLCGLVDAPRFDRCQPPDQRVQKLLPGCGTVVVLGSGGRALWDRVHGSNGNGGPAATGPQPLQQHAAHCARLLVRWLQQHRLSPRAVPATDRAGLNFVQLAEAAGLGTVSPVMHALLHPKFGSWVSICGALLLPGHPFGPIADDHLQSVWEPCSSCSRPCVAACPAGVHDGFGGSDPHRCAGQRRQGACADRCGVREACPLGSEHRYDLREQTLHQTGSLAAMRRWHGLGIWRFLPRFLRS